jgi:hypothetical protein
MLAGTTRIIPGSLPVARFAALTFAAVLAGTVPSAARAQDAPCDDPTAPEVRGLRFEGNRAFSSADLGSRVATTRMSRWAAVPLLGRLVTRHCLDEPTMRLDALRVLYAYRVRGFADASVEPVVEPRGPRAVVVVFRVREGAPTILTRFTVEGLGGVADSASFLRDLPVGSTSWRSRPLATRCCGGCAARATRAPTCSARSAPTARLERRRRACGWCRARWRASAPCRSRSSRRRGVRRKCHRTRFVACWG